MEKLIAPNIKKVIGVVSGKGGVGKSLVTSLLATSLQREGKKVAILDADVTGPSIPAMFGIHKKAAVENNKLIPEITETKIKIMSINLLLNNENDPVIWRGPIIADAVRQFWADVTWGDVDYMLVDMPPGTGDVPLTVFQSLPIDGIVVVSTPQDLVGMIVNKAVKMAGDMNVPILGMVENMSYFECPDCGKKHNIFGESNICDVAAYHGVSAIGKIPIKPELSKLCDEGKIEQFQGDWLKKVVDGVILYEKSKQN